MLVGVQFGYTKCSSHICLYSSRYISFSWGGPLKIFAPNPYIAGVLAIFGGFLGVGSEEGIEMEFWVVLGGFRQPKNGLGRLPATEKTDNNEKKKLQIKMFSKDLGC